MKTKNNRFQAVAAWINIATPSFLTFLFLSFTYPSSLSAQSGNASTQLDGNGGIVIWDNIDLKRLAPVETNEAALQCWPQPAIDHLHLKAPHLKASRIHIIDLHGQEVYDSNVQVSLPTTLSVANLQPGIYFLQLDQDPNTRPKRFTKY